MYCCHTVCVLSSCLGTVRSLATIRTAVQTFAHLTSKPFVKNLNKPGDILKISLLEGLQQLSPCMLVVEMSQRTVLTLMHSQRSTLIASLQVFNLSRCVDNICLWRKRNDWCCLLCEISSDFRTKSHQCMWTIIPAKLLLWDFNPESDDECFSVQYFTYPSRSSSGNARYLYSPHGYQVLNT